MTDRENQRRLDRLALQYLAAVEAENFDVIDALWEQAADDDELGEMLHGLNAELVAEQDAGERIAVDAVVIEAIEQTMPSAEVVRPTTEPVTVAEVAERIRRRPPAGLTADDLKLNDALRQVSEPVPTELGISRVIRWGEQFGDAPDAYWKAFRQAALDLCMERVSAADYRMAARPKRPGSSGGAS
jgi:hypothetical protein